MHASNANYLHRYVPGSSPSWRWPGMPVSELQIAPCFNITPSGFGAFYQFGRDQAYKPAKRLMDNNKILGKDVTLIAHQASDALSNTWKVEIGPADFFSTTKHYANMTVANLPVNLALAVSPLKAQEREEMSLKKVSTPYLLLLALGPDMHAHAVLLGNKSLTA